MSVNINSLFQHLMEDPDIIPPEGETKEDIAMAMATQRAKQSKNNTKALSMAKEDRTVSKLLAFLKAKDDEEDSPLTTSQMNAYASHLERISQLTTQLQEGTSLTEKQQRDWDAAEKFSEDVAQPANLPGIHDVIDRHEEAMVDVVGGEIGEEDDDSDTPVEERASPAPVERVRYDAQVDEESRRKMSPAERKADRERRLAEAQAAQDAEEEAPHHSLTRAVNDLSDADPDADLDHYGNDVDAPFHISRFGDNPKAFHSIHEAYSKEDLAEAYDQLERVEKQLTLNFGAREGGSLVESEIHKLMNNFYEAQGRQKSPLDAPDPISAREGRGEPTKKRTPIESSPSAKWFDENVPDKGQRATEWDAYFKDNNLLEADQDEVNIHLHNFSRAKKLPITPPPKSTPTAEHIEPAVQREIVSASQDKDNPKQKIEAKLAEHTRSVLDDPKLTPHQQKKRIDSANTLGEVAAKEVSTPEKKVTLELPTELENAEDILSQWADVSSEAEANGGTDEEKSTAAQNVHTASLIHEEAGGDPEPVLQAKGVRYRKLKSGQYYFQGGNWGNLSQREAIGQTPEGEPESSPDTPEAQDARQAAFDFDAPPSAVKNLTDSVRERQLEEDLDIFDDFDEEAAGMPEAQWEASAKTDADHDWAKDTGWGSDVDVDYDHFSSTGEQHKPMGYAHEVREYARTHQTEDNPLINALGEPDDDIYAHHGLRDDEPVTLQHVKDYMESKGTTLPKAEWEVEAKPEKTLTSQENKQLAGFNRQKKSTQQKLTKVKEEHDAAAEQFTKLQADLEEANNIEAETPRQQSDKAQRIRRLMREEKRVRAKRRDLQKRIADHNTTIRNTDAAINKITTPTATEEVKPTEEAPKTPTPEPEPQPEEGEAEPEVKVETPEDVDDQSDAEVIAGLKRIRDARRNAPKGQKQQASLDALAQEGHIDPEEADELKTMMEPEAVEEPEAAPQPTRRPRQRKPKVTPEPSAEEAVPDAEPEVADMPDEPLDADVSSEEADETPEERRTGVNNEKAFLLANKMTPEHLASLSDNQVNDEFKQAHKKISNKAMADHLKGIPEKEEVIQDMADAAGRGTDENYKAKLRKDNKYTSIQTLVKKHQDQQQRRADNAFTHASNDANSNALKMDVLPEEGTDKLHALDRARDIAKKLNDSHMSVKEGGRPLLDRNSQSHLKDLLDDAVNKGDIPQDELDELANEADRMGEDYLNDDHQASIQANNVRTRAHHEDFLAHAEGMSEEALQRKGHDLDHSKAHELHDYDTNEDGTIGKRIGSSHHYREEDGAVGHREGAGSPDSADDAVEGMEAQHPPKLLGLDKQGQIEQDEHFKLMKKAAKGELEEGDFKQFTEYEKNNPALADPKYKGQVLGAVRHQLSAEDGAEKMNAMGIDEKDHDEAAGSSCRPPPGAMPPGGDKGWNPDTHRWADKEYLESVKGQLGPGEASYHPEGLHAGTEHAHLDADADGNIQGVMVTPTGVHKVTPSTGGSKGMKSADGGAVNHADVLGHHLQDHPGGKVDKKTLNMMGMNHSEKHTSKGQGALGRAFKETPGMQMAKPVLGKLGRMLSRNKEREADKPNATGQDRQRARRGTDGSPINSVLDRIGKYTKEGLKDAAEELPGYLGGERARDADRYRDKQTRKAVDKVRIQERASQKLTDSVNRVLGEQKY